MPFFVSAQKTLKHDASFNVSSILSLWTFPTMFSIIHINVTGNFTKLQLDKFLKGLWEEECVHVYEVTFPWSLNSDVHVTQMALAALDNIVQWWWHGTGGSTLLIILEATLLLYGHPINHLQRGEALLAGTVMARLTCAALTYTVLFSENWSASRQFCIW